MSVSQRALLAELRAAAMVEATQQFLDNLVLDDIPVFDAEVISALICDEKQLERLRKQSEQP